MTTIIFNEIDDYYEVVTDMGNRRYPAREIALMAAHEYGEEVTLEHWTDEDEAWAQETLRMLAVVENSRNMKPYVPRKMTKTHLRWLGLDR